MTTAHTFQIGNYYSTGRGDYEWNFKVLTRTAKFITIEDKWGDITRVGVRVWEGRESALPLGNYSQAPVISADRIAA